MNKVIKQLLAPLGRVGRAGLYAAITCTALLVTATALPLLFPQSQDQQDHLIVAAGSDANAWGSEALANLSDSAARFSPVALANACGLGASSCFKCHNGKRAALPSVDKQLAPWHVDHAKVNFSCVGCHQGNPRILKQDIAHQGLVSDPRSSEKSCTTCHTAGDVQSLISKYHAVEAGK